MKRPTRLDWLVYRIFRWWWNPIFIDSPILTEGLIIEINRWRKQVGLPKIGEKP